MSGWQSSKWKKSAGWDELSKKVRRAAGYKCEVVKTVFDPKTGVGRRERCNQLAVAADHIRPKSQGGTDARSNLRAICAECHQEKSSQEGGSLGGKAAAKARRERSQRFRRVEDHPGWIG